MRSMCQEPRNSETTHRRDEQRPRRHQREQASLVFPWAELTERASHPQYTSPVIHTLFTVHGREVTFRGLANFPIRQQKIPTARNLADGTVSCLSGSLDVAECRGSRVCVGRTNTHPIKPRSPNAMRARRCTKIRAWYQGGGLPRLVQKVNERCVTCLIFNVNKFINATSPLPKLSG